LADRRSAPLLFAASAAPRARPGCRGGISSPDFWAPALPALSRPAAFVFCLCPVFKVPPAGSRVGAYIEYHNALLDVNPISKKIGLFLDGAGEVESTIPKYVYIEHIVALSA